MRAARVGRTARAARRPSPGKSLVRAGEFGPRVRRAEI